MSESLKWQKSSYSGAGGENCVELARRADTTLIRESDDPRIVVSTTPTRLAAFIAGVKAGHLDHLSR